MRASRFAPAALAALLLAAACGPGEPRIEASLSVARALTGDTAGFLRAAGPRAFSFPADHGPHPGFRTEWWYFTGNLEAEDGRRFGYQLTFFRNQLSAAPAPRTSGWAAHEVFMAHFALTDVAAGEFHAADRFARAARDLAGARGEPLRVWLEDWEAAGIEGRVFPLRLRAAEGDVALDLVLEAGKPPVLQGERGLSRKGPEPGNASYYYSLTRMPTQGTMRVGERVFRVTGKSWMDREWSTSALAEGQVGWDWFSLQLDDGREIMYYQLRRSDGSADPLSKGSLVDADGRVKVLKPDEVRLQVLDHWTSPRSGTRYPARWRLQVPGAGIDLEVTPHLPDQELDLAFRYWEGAVRLRGRAGGRQVTGHGYVELTGYGKAGRAGR